MFGRGTVNTDSFFLYRPFLELWLGGTVSSWGFILCACPVLEASTAPRLGHIGDNKDTQGTYPLGINAPGS